ncbi:hypothetical protein EWM64_g2034 [Hericium alpestre]|uniref:C2H2-type domain-containing protein n=1 Tax=Hericium alpestre TaxID=135208 RepID=A0A4Z0A5H4_9AGAM|nr:hypothetical protein EWM64_g2034 [Hericium alpestre]
MQRSNYPYQQSLYSQQPSTTRATSQGGNASQIHGHWGHTQPQQSPQTVHSSAAAGVADLQPIPFTQDHGSIGGAQNPHVQYQQAYPAAHPGPPALDPSVPPHYANYQYLDHGHPIVPSQQPSDGHQHFIPTPTQLASTYHMAPAQGHHGYDHTSTSAPVHSSSSSLAGASVSPRSASESQHRCELCGQTFTRNYDKKRHLLSSHSDEVHRCVYCGSPFSRPDSLKRHLDKPCDQDPNNGGGTA